VFDFAEQMLASQREFATRVLALGMEANEAATSKAREAMGAIEAQTVAATDATTEKLVNASQVGTGSRTNP
jgi:hypothetical protein